MTSEVETQTPVKASGLDALFERLEGLGDRLSPIVVKEVRQLTRGREFHVSFGIAVLLGLAIASWGAADAFDGSGTSGGWTFSALIVCLGILGLAVVPLGAFNALRNERLEQTLELITLTALSPRRVVIGKLLAQGMKLVTLFAGLAPFIAMSFLLGGVDFATIFVSMLVLFMWSVWACAACLFLSSLFKTRAMSGMLFGGVGIVLLLVLVVFVGSRVVFFFMSTGSFSGGGSAGSAGYWLAIMASFCFASMVNLVLLAENRLSLPSENRITPLRVGLLAQFLLIVMWTVPYINDTSTARSAAAGMLAVCGGIHLASVALFAVTEDLVLPRRVLLRMRRRPAWQRPFAMLLPGGGRGAVYILAQMAIMAGVAWLFNVTDASVSWVLAMCGYICFYTGVPAAILRLWKPYAPASFLARLVSIILLPIMTVLPDIVAYMWDPAAFDDDYSAYHVFDPFRTLSNWSLVQSQGAVAMPAAIGLTGLLAYVTLIYLGKRMTVRPIPIDPKERAEAPAGASRGADIVY